MSFVALYVQDFDRKVSAGDICGIADALAAAFRGGRVDEEAAQAAVREFLDIAIGLRDKGMFHDAFNAMKVIWRVRHDRDLCLEMLVLAVIMIGDANEFLALKDDIDRTLQQDKHILLLLSGGYLLANDLMLFASALSQVSREDVIGIPSFLNFRNRLISRLLEVLKEFVETAGRAAESADILALADGITLHGIARRLLDAIEVNEFNQMLVSLVFGPNVAARVPQDTISSTILDLHQRISADERGAVMLRLLVSLKQAGKAETLASAWLDTDLAISPDYVKAIFKLAELPGMERWRAEAVRLARRALAFSTNASQWQYAKSSIQMRELRGRLLKIDRVADESFMSAGVLPATSREPLPATPDSPHLFVGLFGQARFPSHVLPILSGEIRHHVKPLVEQGWPISYGVSTWNKVGQRAIFDHDAAHFVQERLPHEVNHVLGQLGVSTVGDVRSLLPETVRFSLEKGTALDVLTPEYLCNLLSLNAYLNISDDGTFMTEIGQEVSVGFRGDHNVINQARMWNRLAGFSKLIRQAELDVGRPVTHCLLCRIDLIFYEKQLWENVISPGLGRPSNFVFVDHDPHANFIEGLGDRILFCDVEAFKRIADGERLLKFVMSRNETHGLYRARVHAHSFLETILFENDTKVIQVHWQDIKHEIYRGRLSLPDIRASLQRDLAGANPDLKKFNHLV